MAAFLDICRFIPTAGGTGSWIYATAVTGYIGPDVSGAVDGMKYKYRAESADLSQWEVGEGAYTAATKTLSRDTILFNSSGTTAPINFSAVPQVAIVALKEDLLSIGTFPRGHLWGLTLSTAGSSATFSVAPGEAVSSDGVALMQLTSAINKTQNAWMPGTAGGSLDTGTIAANTTYHVFLVGQASGTSDIIVSLSPTSPAIPFTYSRRIGSMLTDASGLWVRFVQLGDDFLLYNNATVASNLAGTGSPQTVSVAAVPLGIQVIAKLTVDTRNTSGTESRAAVCSPDASLQPFGGQMYNVGAIAVGVDVGAATSLDIRTSTTRQISFQTATNAVSINIGCWGWRDDRGRSY